MRYLTWRALIAAMALTTALATGCSSPPIKVEPIPITANPSEQIEILDAEITSARLNEIHLLAPKAFANAGEALKSAREGLEEGQGVEEILKKVAFGRAQLERAQERAKVVETVLPEVLKARRLALEAGAIELGQDYLAAEERLVELTRGVESDRLDWAQKRSGDLVAEFRDLELRAIKRKALNEARRTLKEAEAEGAQEFAPKTYAFAQQKLKEADDYISENRYQAESIKTKSQEALFQAQRAWQISNQSKMFKEMPPEQIALFVEDLLMAPTQQMQKGDLRNLPFSEQTDVLVTAIAELQAGQEEQRSQIEAARQQIASLEGITQEEKAAKELYNWEQKAAKEKLERERRFQQLFNEVQSLFDSSDAEIYKQGNHLVIRLRGIRFPVGQAVIMPENYPLLGKVRRAIETFKDPAITIEGHTDSTGSDQANAALSQRRADAVREFFLANGTLPGEKVIAVGYGSRRPLAPNTTAEGRAINRRIDVIITPQAQAAL